MNLFYWLKTRTKLIRKRSIHRLKMRWHSFRYSRPNAPIFILATERTGSNLLLSFLESIPQLTFASEILNPDMYYGLPLRGVPKRTALRHIADSVGFCGCEVCGAKLLLSQMRSRGIDTDDLLALFPSARFIVLYRESLLDQFVSLTLARKTDMWKWTSRWNPPQEINIDPREFERFCAETVSSYRGLMEKEGVREKSLVLSYEMLVQDPQSIFNEFLFPLMGLEPVPVKSSLRKQNLRGSKELVGNYFEVRAIADRYGARINHVLILRRSLAQDN